MAKILLEKGADPTIRYRIPNDTIPADNDASEPQPPPRTRTALSLAAVNGPAELVRMLLAHGANASAQDGDGVSALHEAIAACLSI
jgi:ankyrin repeat protein